MTIRPIGRHFAVCDGPRLICLTWRKEFALQAVQMLSVPPNQNKKEVSPDEKRPDPTIA
jgi:hypothetical protein